MKTGLSVSGNGPLPPMSFICNIEPDKSDTRGLLDAFSYNISPAETKVGQYQRLADLPVSIHQGPCHNLASCNVQRRAMNHVTWAGVSRSVTHPRRPAFGLSCPPQPSVTLASPTVCLVMRSFLLKVPSPVIELLQGRQRPALSTLNAHTGEPRRLSALPMALAWSPTPHLTIEPPLSLRRVIVD